MKMSNIPSFGNLEGVKVAFHAVNVAVPFAAELMAENGATVIQIESARQPDQSRIFPIPYVYLGERKNVLDLTLDLSGDEGKEVLLRLAEKVDILLEGNKGGTYEKWGLTDEALWERNPKLVIVHVSGFGQTGVQEYVTRPSFDAVGQAFGGWMYLNGEPSPQPPIKGAMYIGDYVSALFACWSALAAYIGTQQTGKGESVDLAMYEAMWKIQGIAPMAYLNSGQLFGRMGNVSPGATCVDNMICGDGEYVSLSATGAAAIRRAIEFFGLQDDPMYPPDYVQAKEGTESGERLDKLFREYCLQHTAKEVEQELLAAGIPVSCIYNVKTIQDDPHVQARNLFTTWEDPTFGEVKGVNAVPKMKVRPAQIWRGAPGYGDDNADILSDLGYSEDDVNSMLEDGTIAKPVENGGFTVKKLR